MGGIAFVGREDVKKNIQELLLFGGRKFPPSPPTSPNGPEKKKKNTVTYTQVNEYHFSFSVFMY